MSKYKSLLFSVLVGLFLGVISLFNTNVAFADVWVNGYTRSNGTYVQGYYRSSPDSNPYNNYSYPGNLNPYTGKIAPGNTSTYLNNYYNSGSSYLGSTSYTSPSYISPYTYSGGYSSLSTKTIDGGYYIGSSVFCNSGYYKSDESCVRAPSNATALYTDFICNSGYYKTSGACEKVPEGGYSTSTGFECNSGYWKKGNQCFKPLNGYISGSSLYCNSGYVVNSTKDDCISYDSWCLNALGGINALYDSTAKECACVKGTVYSGTYCVDTNSQCRNTFGFNSYAVDDKNCGCSAGYEFNSAGNACVQSVSCGADQVKVNDQCVSKDQSCKNTYGNGSFSQGSLCYCSSGYSWSKDLKTCDMGSKSIIAKQLKVGSKGQDVVVVQNFLAQQKMYSGRVDSPISKETIKSIVQFQKENKIESTGVIGPKTIQKINQILKSS